MRTILLAAALFLASCAPPSAANGSAGGDTTTGTTKAGEDEKSCAAKGGTLQRICLMGKLACVVTYADAGKPCTGKEQCLGQCRFEGGKMPPTGESAMGACQRTSNPCGCFATVQDGKIDAAMCVD